MAILKHADFEVPGFGEFAIAPVATPAYADAVNALGPLAYWRLGEQSGSTLADQASTHPLTLTGSHTLAQAGAIYHDSDDALFFDGGTAESAGPVLPTGSGDAFSILFWIRVAPATTPAGLFLGQFDAVATGHLRLLLLSTGAVRYILTGDATVQSSAVVTSDWHMFVLTRSADGALSWYIDGNLDVQDTGHGSAVTNTTFRLGALNASPPDVYLDEVAVFDFDLSADDAHWLHGLGAGRLPLPTGF